MVKENIFPGVFRMSGSINVYEAYASAVYINGQCLPKTEFIEFAKEVIKQEESAAASKVAEQLEYAARHGE